MMIVVIAILILLGYNSLEQIEKAGKFKLFIFVHHRWKGFGMKQNYIPSKYFLANVNKQAADVLPFPRREFEHFDSIRLLPSGFLTLVFQPYSN